ALARRIATGRANANNRFIIVWIPPKGCREKGRGLNPVLERSLTLASSRLRSLRLTPRSVGNYHGPPCRAISDRRALSRERSPGSPMTLGAFKGRLTPFNQPEILKFFRESGKTGFLQLSRDGAAKGLYVRRGRVAAAESSDPRDSLLALVAASGSVPKEKI